MNPETIQRFFRKECSSREAEQVVGFFKKNPAMLEKYVSTEEWNSLPAQQTMPDEFWNDIWQSIQQKNKQRAVIIKLKRFAVAACIVSIIALSFYFSATNKKVQQTVAEKNIAPSVNYKTISNTTSTVMKITLEDNSMVELSPSSTIKFIEPFAAEKRDITLEGQAVFHVAKNKKRPFTVYSGMLATTALGTVFSIKKTANKNSVTIKLFEGKVVIRSVNFLKGWNKDVYLLPGRQMSFDADLNTVAVNKIDVDKTTVVTKNIAANKDTGNNEMQFTNTALTEVMHKLSMRYNVAINFDSSLNSNMNFTGTINKNDSLSVILRAIVEMNGLEMKQDSSGITIFKQQ